MARHLLFEARGALRQLADLLCIVRLKGHRRLSGLRRKSAVSRTSLSTASLLWGQFRFKGVSFYCCRSVTIWQRSLACSLRKNLCLTRLCAMKFFSRLVMWLSPITRTRDHLYHSQHRYRIFRLRHVLSVEAISAHKTLLFYVVCVPVLLVRRIVSEARI